MKPIEEELENVEEKVRMRRKTRMVIMEETEAHVGATTPPATSSAAGAQGGDPHPIPQRKATKMFGSDLPRNDSDTSTKSFRRAASAVGLAKTAIRPMGHASMAKTAPASLEDSMLFDILKPIFICMKISGIFFPRPKLDMFYRKQKRIIPLKGYCVVMAVFLIINFLRSLLTFDNNDAFGYELFFKVMWCIFWYEGASRSLLNLWLCWPADNGLEKFILKLESTCYPDRIIPYEQSLRSKQRWFLAYCFCTSFTYVGICAYGFFGPSQLKQLFDLLLLPLAPDQPNIVIWKGILLVLTFVGSFVGSISLVFYVVLCYVLYKEFEYHTRTFAMKIREDGQFMDDLERFRIMHQKRCKLVEDADWLFKYYIANAYMTQVPMLCLQLYNLISSDQEAIHRLVGTLFLGFVAVQMAIVSVAAILVNGQAHAPLEYIYSIRGQAATTDKQLVVNMFLNRLTGTSIGLTAWDMFVLNKPTMLTVVGLILTYFFLLVQFQNPIEVISSCSCHYKTDNGSLVKLPAVKL